jgi:hypothetical protein
VVEPVVKVGVALDPRPDELAEWLADAAAFEAAGVAALWIGLAPDGELDPLVLTAALAVVTSRALLLVSLPATAGPVQALVTVGRLSRGRLRVVADDDRPSFPDGGDGEVDVDVELGVDVDAGVDVARVRLGPHDADPMDDVDDPAERWVTVPSPENRSAWQATMVDVVERGYSRLMVPANPRLLDILRNPEEPGDRHDLQLAQG